MASLGDIYDLNRLPPDDAGRTPSVPTDQAGEIPLRARLDAIVSAAKGAATPSEVEALVEGLASTLATLRQEHETLKGKHANLIEQVGQVLDAVGQIPTERAGGLVTHVQTHGGVFEGAGESETTRLLMHGLPVFDAVIEHVRFDYEAREIGEEYSFVSLVKVRWKQQYSDWGKEPLQDLGDGSSYVYSRTRDPEWQKQAMYFQPQVYASSLGQDETRFYLDLTFAGDSPGSAYEIRNFRTQVAYQPTPTS